MEQAQRIVTTSMSAPSYGGIEIDPAIRQIKVDGKEQSHSVEPRVMQVLLTLHGATGRVISRDSLASSCWDSLDVSEDAINRAVAKLRAVLAAAGATCTVETVRGVGYRLVACATASAAPISDHAIVPALDLETRALSAMFEGTAESLASAIGYFDSLVASQPAVAAHRGSMAMALLLMIPHAAPAMRGEFAARAREAATEAQRLQPGEGRSLAALAGLEPTFGNWAGKNRQLTAALAVSPPAVAPLLFQQVLFLAHSGQTRAALAIAAPLAVAAPLVPWIQAVAAHLHAAEGEWQQADQILAVSHARWPKDRLTWLACFHLWLHRGLVAKALTLLDQGTALPAAISTSERALLACTAAAMATGDEAARSAARKLCQASLSAGRSQLENAVLCSAHLGAHDDAVRLLQTLFQTEAGEGTGSIAFAKIGLEHVGERNAAILFIAPMRPLLKRPEVSALCRDIGLADYWASMFIEEPWLAFRS